MEPSQEPVTDPEAAAEPTDEVEDANAMLTMPTMAKVDLTNWEEYARPTECVLVTLSLLLVVLALNGHDWMSGATEHGKLIVVGLGGAREGGAEPYALMPACEALGPPGNSTSVACALASAGASASTFGGLALTAALVLAATFAVEALAARGHLAPLQAKLPPDLPLDKVASAIPAAMWSLLLVFTLFTLLLYAAKSPNSLGGGYVRLGLSYGLLRLSLVVSLTGLVVHLSLVHKLGEDAMVNALDALKGSWGTLVPRQKATILLLYLALLMQIMLWIRRVEWGCLVLLYGLWAYTHRHHDHLCAFCALALFSLGTDAISLAHEDSAVSLAVPIATWVLIVSKCAAAGLMIYYKDAFA